MDFVLNLFSLKIYNVFHKVVSFFLKQYFFRISNFRKRELSLQNESCTFLKLEILGRKMKEGRLVLPLIFNQQ